MDFISASWMCFMILFYNISTLVELKQNYKSYLH